MHLARFPRQFLAHLPTPLEPMPRLSQHCNHVNLWIKRDDCTGMSSGGNKTRKLEFLFGEACQQQADTIITQGAVQSNHARQTAAFAAKLGMSCYLLLESRIDTDDRDYNYNGNVLLNRLHGAEIGRRPAGTDMNQAMQELADELIAKGKKPYIIPGGGSNPVGALGYVNAAFELLAQANDRGLKIDHIVHATGSSGTQAGLITGLELMNSQVPLLGIGVRAPQTKQEQMVFDLAQKTCVHMNVDPALVQRDKVKANCNYVGDGYGIPTDGMLQALKQCAQLEGLLFDPVYSGKGMAGLIDLCNTGFFKPNENVVFIHTGGSVGLFGYSEQLELHDYDPNL